MILFRILTTRYEHVLCFILLPEGSIMYVHIITYLHIEQRVHFLRAMN